MHAIELWKIGGNELDDPEFMAGLATAVAQHKGQLVLVHGGGRAVTYVQAQLGLQAQLVDGVRVTDEAALRAATMVLCGLTNKQLVAALLAASVPAVGLSGVDGGLLRVAKASHPTIDLGRVGQVQAVSTDVLRTLLGKGFVPVIAPISVGVDGELYNVNADHAAGALAGALGARAVHFISNVAGVLDDGIIIKRLTAHEARYLIRTGIIHGGMVPKVEAALAALRAGVGAARIVNLAGLKKGGTTLVAEPAGSEPHD